MPDRGELTKEAADAILQAIKDGVPKFEHSASALRELAYAYALVTGAKPGHLPGHQPFSTS